MAKRVKKISCGVGRGLRSNFDQINMQPSDYDALPDNLRTIYTLGMHDSMWATYRKAKAKEANAKAISIIDGMLGR